MDDGSSGPHKSHKVRSSCGRLSLGQRAGSFVQRLGQFIGLGHRMPTVSGVPGRISDGLIEAINLLIEKVLAIDNLLSMWAVCGVEFLKRARAVRAVASR